MLKVKPFVLIILVLIVLSVLFPFIGQSSVKKSTGDQRLDRINIELGAQLSKEEMPAVGFLHDLHTQAVDGKCTVCHIEKEDGVVFKFKRTDETASMDFYHNNCISCHLEKKAAKEKAGPAAEECRVCHTGAKPKAGSWTKINFDKSLHFVHTSTKEIKSKDAAGNDNCSACHHKYNEKSKEIFYVMGEEESCGYCHKSETQNNISPIRQASHGACVKCHQTLKNKNVGAGPLTCEGCHDKAQQQKITKISDIPRLKRNQPDEVASTGWKTGAQDTKNFMDGVAFNHKGHETRTQSCKVCHHESLKKCKDCHTPEGGDKKGGFISLANAMHTLQSDRSCVGCHKDLTTNSDCAGCHFQAPVRKSGSQSCKVCHNLAKSDLKSMDGKAVAKKALTARSQGYKRVTQDKIPEKIVIDILSREYQPGNFPHAKIIQAITERVEKSNMARAFHTDQAGLCMGCHHNSPKTLEPPKCASCHSKNGPGPDGRPGLKGAYHGQCITCHQKMDVKSVAATDCAKCHEKKK